MKALIVEDDFVGRVILQELLHRYGPAHVAVNGQEAVEAVKDAIQSGSPYTLICLDILMPLMDGQEALRKIRAAEADAGVPHSAASKIIMVSALNDLRSVSEAYSELCDSYLVKPVRKPALVEALQNLALIA